ncbi:MAG: hypothetical protein K5696_04530, partial [Lachnospiraceae bacterium]|nr:hypothetical protein [Lachnospiraceae bacterium]
ASIPDQTYTGAAIKPAVKVYDGVKVVDAKNYSVSYKKNAKAGTGEVSVKFKGEMKQKAGNKPIGNYFNIAPAVLGTNLLLQNMGVKYNGKLQKPKPILLWEATGKKQAFSAANFTITYWDANDEVVQGVKDEGTYTVAFDAKSANFTGRAQAQITVKSTDLVEKMTIQTITKKYTVQNGNPVFPVYGTDFTIKLPKGYTAIPEKPFGYVDDRGPAFRMVCLGNRTPGRMALVISGTGDTYVGTKVVYLTVKKGN